MSVGFRHREPVEGRALDGAVVAHYWHIAPVMQQLFDAVPIVWAAYSQDANKPMQLHAHYYGNWMRLGMAHVERPAIGAEAFYSWSPLHKYAEQVKCTFVENSGNVASSCAGRTLVKRRPAILDLTCEMMG